MWFVNFAKFPESVILWNTCDQMFRSSRPKVLCIKGVFKISLNSLENTCARSSEPTLLKKRLWHKYFPMNFVKFPRTPFFAEHL